MNEIYSIELGRQLMKPSGEIGKKVGENMNIANNAIYDLACTMIDFKDNERILEIGFGNGNFFPKYLLRKLAPIKNCYLLYIKPVNPIPVLSSGLTRFY